MMSLLFSSVVRDNLTAEQHNDHNMELRSCTFIYPCMPFSSRKSREE